MTLYSTLLNAIKRYSLAGSPEVEMQPEEHISIPGSVPVRYLGSCPRQNALSRRNHPVIVPGLAWGESARAVISMEFGKRMGTFVQQALRYADLCAYHEVEVNVHLEEPALHGRIDAIIHHEDRWHILEIKVSQGGYGKPATPFWKYIYQTMAYGIMMARERNMQLCEVPMHILILEQGSVQLYSLTPRGEGFIVVDQNGERWNHQWNDSAYINERMVLDAARQQHMFLQMETTELLRQQPITNPLNNGGSPLVGETWACAKLNKPRSRSGGEGTCKSNCSYACHPELQTTQTVRIEVDSSGRATFLGGTPQPEVPVPPEPVESGFVSMF